MNVTDFMKDRKILLVEPNPLTRQSTFDALIHSGIDRKQILISRNERKAKEYFETQLIAVVITEQKNGDVDGIELIRVLRSMRDCENITFILTSSRPDHQSIHLATQEDIDDFWVTPLKTKAIGKRLNSIVERRLNPDPYQRFVKLGTKALSIGKIQESVLAFERAKNLNPNAGMAEFFLDQSKILLNSIDSFGRLSLERKELQTLHQQSLLGLYRKLFATKNYTAAYPILKEQVRRTSETPENFKERVKLALLSRKFPDLLDFSQNNRLLVRYSELKNTLSAALVLAGEQILKSEDFENSLSYFQKSITLGTPSIDRALFRIVNALKNSPLVGEAPKFLQKFSPSGKKKSEFLVLNYEVLDKIDSTEPVVLYGRNLLEQGIHSSVVYDILVRRYLDSGHPRYAEPLIYEAAALFPRMRQHFLMQLSRT